MAKKKSGQFTLPKLQGTFNADASQFTHELPADLQATAETAGVSWDAVVAAMKEFGVPLVVGVVTALASGNYIALVDLGIKYGLPLVMAIIQALQA